MSPRIVLQLIASIQANEIFKMINIDFEIMILASNQSILSIKLIEFR